MSEKKEKKVAEKEEKTKKKCQSVNELLSKNIESNNK